MKNKSYEKRDLVCWLLADNTLPEWKLANEESLIRMRSLLKHTFIFNVFDQNLVVSDAQVLNNNTLRILMRTDEDIQQYINFQMLNVAVRSENNQPPLHFKQLIEQFKAYGKYLFDAKRLEEGDELDFIWNNAKIIPFDIKALATRYADETIATLSAPLTSQTVPEQLLKRVVELANKERIRLNAEEKELGWIFFYQDLAEQIDQQDWILYGPEIDKLATARYQTNLPQFLTADAIYSKKHASAFETVRGVRQNKTMQESRFQFKGKLGLAAYERGINLLQFDDIINLLDSDEAEEFAITRSQIDTSDQASKALSDALANYVYAIERMILEKDSGFKTKSVDGNEREIGITFERFAKGTNKFADFLGIFFIPISVASNILNRIVFDRYFDRKEQGRLNKERKNTARHMQQRDVLRAELDEDKSNQIDVYSIIPKETNTEAEQNEIEVFYK